MAVSPDLNFQNFSTVQSAQQLAPATLAAAATIAPTTFITFVTGTTNIATITPPVTGQHMLCLIFTNGSPGSLLTTGNILVSTTTIVQNRPLLIFYDNAGAKYYPATP